MNLVPSVSSEAVTVPPRDATGVDEFCQAHDISRAFFYLLLREGRGPRVMRIGRRTLITAEAARDWRRAMEAQTAGEAA